MASYQTLPYDVLHQIYVASKACHMNHDSPSVLFNFSCVDRRTREGAIPVLFRTVSFKKQWLGTSQEYIDGLINAISKNSQIMQAIR